MSSKIKKQIHFLPKSRSSINYYAKSYHGFNKITQKQKLRAFCNARYGQQKDQKVAQMMSFHGSQRRGVVAGGVINSRFGWCFQILES
ncbi:hypothetical protein OWV82_018121 [Melia azedarach]|uniref:Uncharacterized protein n=1 Tax=Melia azedarach TaxID=155640 RepID=A0ACC1XCW0_MELAZ|nr:hypothetical protein OWV82_018121 [Melia azedarach]